LSSPVEGSVRITQLLEAPALAHIFRFEGDETNLT
jgi:hypothetical protein